MYSVGIMIEKKQMQVATAKANPEKGRAKESHTE